MAWTALMMMMAMSAANLISRGREPMPERASQNSESIEVVRVKTNQMAAILRQIHILFLIAVICSVAALALILASVCFMRANLMLMMAAMSCNTAAGVANMAMNRAVQTGFMGREYSEGASRVQA